ncbi:lipase family protein [Nocardia implantans]|uniref:Lipase family protein n=1 Tax=Nocardia implantans TaxID=3108168 RepID=A0ABU6AP64_9NOCA|nr:MULTISPECIES: lipase family protein [unclassified Nocardia]MBF6189597.1 triacylglycerol lipase [Nocardia beijingensis]MEA3527175.1 lipase family protein [Nocardia sp. CDC192]MEB3509247.1 lipase family protein [Nocardia sp. CDC186]
MWLTERRGSRVVISRKHAPKLLAALAAVAVGLPSLPGSAAAEPQPDAPVVQPALPFPIPPLPPGFDPAFYRPPAQTYADLAPGQIIAARQVNLANLSLLPVNVDAWQLSYRSTNSRGEAIAAVATVIKPRGYVADRPLFSYQIAEDSTGNYCMPSYQLQMGSIPATLTGSTLVAAQFLEVQAALAQGWAAVIPDHQGPDSAYAAGPLAGRITLDGIRAAENFAPMQLSGTGTRVGMMGYSGGAIATGWAAELKRAYAPELNVVGAAEGGIPADLSAALRMANGNLSAGLIFAGALGVSREYPQLRRFLDENANGLGRLMIAGKEQLCASYQAALFPFADNLGMLAKNPFTDPAVVDVLNKTKLGQAVPDMPMLMYQANADWLIPVGPVNELVGTYAKDPGARVEYIRDHFSEHLTLDPIAAPRALLWLKDRFAGVPVADGVTVTDVGSMTLDPATWQVWGETVGDVLAAAFGQPIGSGR